LIAGKQHYIDILEKHPLARALRLDKMVLAALEQTLRMYAYAPDRLEALPVVRMLKASSEDLRRRASRLVRRLQDAVPGCRVQAVQDVSQVGGGACPLRELPTWAIELDPGPAGASALERRLRLGQPCVVARIRNDRIVLDMRTVLPGEIKFLFQALRTVLSP
jgi:L-seryl-tRNA(Ser) seleniumtransferase